MTETKFQDPPMRKRGEVDWASVAEQLRQRPGEWALVTRANPSVVPQVKRGRYQALPRGEFEATSRNVRDGKAEIYLRYVGGAE